MTILFLMIPTLKTASSCDTTNYAFNTPIFINQVRLNQARFSSPIFRLMCTEQTGKPS
jgi:hypothetical protein